MIDIVVEVLVIRLMDGALRAAEKRIIKNCSPDYMSPFADVIAITKL